LSLVSAQFEQMREAKSTRWRWLDNSLWFSLRIARLGIKYRPPLRRLAITWLTRFTHPPVKLILSFFVFGDRVKSIRQARFHRVVRGGIHRSPPDDLGDFESLVELPYAIVPQLDKVHTRGRKQALINSYYDHRGAKLISEFHRHYAKVQTSPGIGAHEGKLDASVHFLICHLKVDPKSALDWERTRRMNESKSGAAEVFLASLAR
jgi:hypothetical protein